MAIVSLRVDSLHILRENMSSGSGRRFGGVFSSSRNCIDRLHPIDTSISFWRLPSATELGLNAGCVRTFRLGHLGRRMMDGKKLEVPVHETLMSRRIRVSTDTKTVEPSETDGGDGESGGGGEGGGGGGEGDALSLTTSVLVFAFWAGLISYGIFFAPNQTGYRDFYFLQKLVGLNGNDGFIMNQVLIAEFQIMGWWPVIYSMLLIPSGRSSKGRVPVKPFVIASLFAGVFALLPYFALWKPPPPLVSKNKLKQFPLSWLESKILAVVVALAGIFLAGFAFSAGSETWTEFFQYFSESRFIHIMSIDFLTLSMLAPFWVYNDMSVREWDKKGFWLVPLAIVPFFGPALYLILRPQLPSSLVSDHESSL